LSRRNLAVLATSGLDKQPRAIIVEINNAEGDKIVITDNEMGATKDKLIRLLSLNKIMTERVFTQTFAVAAAIIEKEGKVMLVRENLPGNPDDGKWSHPAGWIDAGEHPVEAVKREAKEETGYEFTPTHLVGIYSLVRQDLAGFRGCVPHAIKLVFAGDIADHSEKNLLGDTRGTKWFLFEEIYAMKPNELRDADIKQIVRDYFSSRRYPLEIIKHSTVY